MPRSRSRRARGNTIAGAVVLIALSIGAGGQSAAASEPKTAQACTRTVTGALVGPQSVGAGESLCLRNANLEGAITVSASGSLSSLGSTVTGAITLSGATDFTVCNSTVGAISATGGVGALSIGNNHACGGNTIDGAVTLNGNTGAVRLAGNVVSGAVTVNGNATGAAAGPRIADNAIGGDLSCATNVPPPTNTGRPNTVVGVRSGQCVAVTF